MFRSLIVPLDGSAFAEQALPMALSIARRAGACLRLVRVHVPIDLSFGGSMSPWLALEAEANLVNQERSYLDGVAKRVAAIWPVSVVTALVEGCPIAEILTSQAQTQGADLIVMTTHGRGPLTRWWLGSVADELMRRAPVPLLLIRPHEGVVDLAEEPHIRRILIPLDGSKLAENVLEPALDLGALRQADYSLVRVWNSETETQVDPYLEGIAKRMRAQGHTVHEHAVIGQAVAATILQQARAREADLIALASHGRGRRDRLLVGSVADKLVRGANLPVLVQTAAG